MDALSQLIIAEMARQREAEKERVPYGVWLSDIGWLKNEQGRLFADLNKSVAESAATLCGEGAIVLPMDLPDADGKNALQTLEAKFLERQVFLKQQANARRERTLFARFKRLIRQWLTWTP